MKLKELPVDYVGVVFDPPGKTFRDELFAAYKAQRPPMPWAETGQALENSPVTIRRMAMMRNGKPVFFMSGVLCLGSGFSSVMFPVPLAAFVEHGVVILERQEISIARRGRNGSTKCWPSR